ncbi:rRNA biogenesis protein rrp36 [Penicillium taxi]|uniref:rRNA biogenesis protein rrp36 n=1 Tax=Penicillium taxi TaxID=168475 RepID=UPI002544E6A4|nr:rRNA biogenesis protein rrp36 [Penicillium taxi]KAJ5902519.1 rRNA biogenesis protein rrp36 [Penicillium taxi]
MAISDMLNRRVRAQPDQQEDIYSEESNAEEVSSDENEEEGDSDEDMSDSDEKEDDEELEDEETQSSNSEGDDDIQASLSNISFGALAKAQASMGPKKRKGKASEESETASPLDDIREKIREAREQKREAATKLAGSKSQQAKEKKEKARASKHAPMVQSSKYAVTRKRQVVEPPNVAKARDPRFDAAVMGYSGAGRHNQATSNAYAFLDDYRESELKDLKTQMSRTKNEAQKEALKRQIRSATDRMKTRANEKREREVVSEHNKREKELIREGKKSTPYYLKQSDLKKKVMEKKYSEMKSKDRSKALERRRKKMASKERKEMPWERRGAGGNDAPPNRGERWGNGGDDAPPKRRRFNSD